jgi:hypothetical protein
MKNDKLLRQNLINLLTGSDAHVNFDKAIANVPAGSRGKKTPGTGHTLWEILEHLRITQNDILEFSRNPAHKSPEFPRGYWPATHEPPTEKAWDESAEAFRKDLRAFCDLIALESTDLYENIPHGDGQTVLREALLTADHASYHLGELVRLRRLLGVWPEA